MSKLAEDSCPVCNGEGKILSKKTRVIGYTLGVGETTDEEDVPCPLCQRVEAGYKAALKAVGKLLEDVYLIVDPVTHEPEGYWISLADGNTLKRGKMPKKARVVRIDSPRIRRTK